MNRRLFVTSIAAVGVSSTAGCLGGLFSNDEELPEEAPDDAWESYDGSGGVNELTVDGIVDLEPRQYVHELVQLDEDADLMATIQVEGGSVDLNIFRPDDFEAWLEQDSGVTKNPNSEVTIQDKTVESHLGPPNWQIVVHNGPNGPDGPDWGPVRVELSLQVKLRE